MTKFLPLPANSGGRQRTWAVLERLLDRGPTTVCAFDDGQSDNDELIARGAELVTVPWPQSKAAMARGVLSARSATAGRFYSEELAQGIRKAAFSTWPLDLLHVEYTQLIPYGAGIPARMRVLDLHNVESDLTQSYAARSKVAVGSVLRAEAFALKRLEQSGLRQFHLVSVVSERDKELLGADENTEVVVCRNGCEPTKELPPSADPVVAFVATLGWAPNVDAAVWFTESVWPKVLESLGSARLLLVGRDPSDSVRKLADDSVTVTGTVPEVAPFLQQSSVAIAPLRAGGGSRLKILEALMAGRPVVATTIGVSGLEDLIGHGVVVADEPETMAKLLVELLSDPLEAQRLGKIGREAVLARYSWDSTLAPLLERLPQV